MFMIRKIRNAITKAKEYEKKKKLRRTLKTREFSIISNNCWGSFIYQKYGIRYQSPTVGLFIKGHDFVKFCADLDRYLSYGLCFIPWEESTLYPEIRDEKRYPIAKLGDIEVYFMHYASEEEAREKWTRRASRLCRDKMIYKLSQREGCSKEDVEAFLSLPLKNKVCFAYDPLPGAVHVPELSGFSGDEQPIVEKYFDEKELINSL